MTAIYYVCAFVSSHEAERSSKHAAGMHIVRTERGLSLSSVIIR